MVPVVLHGLLGSDGILAPEHLDEGVALVLVHDAGLNLAVPAEDLSQLGLGACDAAHEKSPAQHLDVTIGQGRVVLDPLVLRLGLGLGCETAGSGRRALAVAVTSPVFLSCTSSSAALG